MTFTDPRTDHPLLVLQAKLEEATDAFTEAANDEAAAENEYLRVHSIAYTKAAAEGVAATVRGKHADAQPDVVAARQAWNLAQARAKTWRLKWSELEARLNASQSYYRLIRDQT